MLTDYLIIHPDGTEEAHQVDLPQDPGFESLNAIIKPIIGQNRNYEHVAVLFEGKRADMFVDEEGRLVGLQRNDSATAIYRNNTLTAHPGTDPEMLDYIVGTAMLFKRRVWF
ncbi:hypothetical protein [Pseudomonas syringae]|nr:hypothetical protein [Pseudomonas syringae]